MIIEMEALISYFSIFLCVYFLVILVKFFRKVWWTPLRVQSVMKSQGLKGPSYRVMFGNSKEILTMTSEVMSSPMELSHDIFRRIQPHVYSWAKIYGMNILSWHGPEAQIILTEPELIKEVLNNKDGGYVKPDVQTYMKKIAGDGLVTTSDEEKWSKVRKLANHAFHAESLKSTIPEMIASVEMMLDTWRQYAGQEIDVYKEFKVLTSEIISRSAFGSNYFEGKHIFDMLTKMSSIFRRNYYKIGIPGIGKLIKAEDDIESEKLQERVRDSILKIVKKREEEAILDRVDSYGRDFLGLLVKAYHDPDESMKISLDDLIDECKTIYLAGHETTASSLTWTALLLAIHTDWQDKVRNEVVETCGHRNPCPDSISKMKIMSMVVNESLRLYPPAVYMIRKAGREVRLGKLVVPAGMRFFISILALHHRPEIWGEDVHLFKPERFAEGVGKATNNSTAAFLPFGSGPRICAGFNFALTEMKIALSMILQKYRFTLSPSYIHSPSLLITIYPQHGVQVILQPL